MNPLQSLHHYHPGRMPYGRFVLFSVGLLPLLLDEAEICVDQLCKQNDTFFCSTASLNIAYFYESLFKMIRTQDDVSSTIKTTYYIKASCKKFTNDQIYRWKSEYSYDCLLRISQFYSTFTLRVHSLQVFPLGGSIFKIFISVDFITQCNNINYYCSSTYIPQVLQLYSSALLKFVLALVIVFESSHLLERRTITLYKKIAPFNIVALIKQLN